MKGGYNIAVSLLYVGNIKRLKFEWETLEPPTPKVSSPDDTTPSHNKWVLSLRSI